jgi:hypothetical protein
MSLKGEVVLQILHNMNSFISLYTRVSQKEKGFFNFSLDRKVTLLVLILLVQCNVV